MGLDMYFTRRNKAKDLEVEIYYWRKFWDLYEYIWKEFDPKETNINGQEVHVDKELFEKSLNSVAITLITLIHLIVFQNQQKNYITLMSEQKKVGHIILWEIIE